MPNGHGCGIFAIGFALGIVSGIVLTFELGLNWGDYARAAGPILGPMICMEALMAFFLEAGFSASSSGERAGSASG
jgi:cytochrome d ubiquinol oxidase subunit I